MPNFSLPVVSNDVASAMEDTLRENGFCSCDRCDDWGHEDDMTSVVTSWSHRGIAMHDTWCEYCASADASRCCDCGETVHDDNVSIYGGDSLCDNCYDHGNYCTCENCGDIINTYSDNCTVDDDGCVYCESCARDNDNDDDDDDDDDDVSQGLGGYHTDATRNRFPSGDEIAQNALGIELELYALSSSSRDSVAGKIRALGCAVERDGSLCSSRGLEVITPPLPLSELRPILAGLCSICVSEKVIGQVPGNKGYGIHVNLNAKHWTDTKRKAFCNQFCTANKSWLEAIAGRTENQWAQYKNNESEEYLPSSKYDAAALKSGGRIEVRIFRSTNYLPSVVGFATLCEDIARFVDCDPFRKPSGLLDWLERNGQPETCDLIARKLGRARYVHPEYVSLV